MLVLNFIKGIWPGSFPPLFNCQHGGESDWIVSSTIRRLENSTWSGNLCYKYNNSL